MTGIDENYIIRVADLMKIRSPRCRLPRPKLKPTILVTGWEEWLPLIQVECET